MEKVKFVVILFNMVLMVYDGILKVFNKKIVNHSSRIVRRKRS